MYSWLISKALSEIISKVRRQCSIDVPSIPVLDTPSILEYRIFFILKVLGEIEYWRPKYSGAVLMAHIVRVLGG